MDHIKESDWKYLRKIKDEILRRHCGAILEYIEMIVQNRHGEEYMSYLQVSRAIRDKDIEISNTHDDLKRSNAIMKICEMRRHLAMTDEEFMKLSEETKDMVNRILDFE